MNLTLKRTTIHGYLCELDVDVDGAGTTCCDISKGRYSGSLARLDAIGCLYDSDFNDGPPVPRVVIEEIEKWALANGY